MTPTPKVQSSAAPLALLIFSAPLAAAQLGSDEYQVNQATASLSMLDEDPGTGTSFATALRWTREEAVIDLTVDPNSSGTIFLALGDVEIMSRSEGALVTANDQLFHLDRQHPSFRMLNVTSRFNGGCCASLALKLDQPDALAAQLMVLSPSHPDGFVLSAPAVLRWEFARSTHFFSGTLSESALDTYEIGVASTEPPTVGTLDPFSSEAFVPAITNGVARLHTQSGTLVAPLEVDNATGAFTTLGTPIFTIRDIFPAALQGSGNDDVMLEVEFEQPVHMDSPELGAEPQDKTYKTDKGRPVDSVQDGHPDSPDITQAEADMALMDLNLPGPVVQTGPPTDSFNCHGKTFNGGMDWQNKGVKKTLKDNGYEERGPGEVMDGDVAVYKNPDGGIEHTGTVTLVDGTGNPREVESKWGRGPTYKHEPGNVPPDYGTPTYYGTPRTGGNTLKCK